MGRSSTTTFEHLAPSDQMIARTRRRLLQAARALRDKARAARRRRSRGLSRRAQRLLRHEGDGAWQEVCTRGSSPRRCIRRARPCARRNRGATPLGGGIASGIHHVAQVIRGMRNAPGGLLRVGRCPDPHGGASAAGPRDLQGAGRDQHGHCDGRHGARGRGHGRPAARRGLRRSGRAGVQPAPRKGNLVARLAAPARASRSCCSPISTSFPRTARIGRSIRSSSPRATATITGGARPTTNPWRPRSSRISSATSRRATGPSATSSWRSKPTRRSSTATAVASSGC